MRLYIKEFSSFSTRNFINIYTPINETTIKTQISIKFNVPTEHIKLTYNKEKLIEGSLIDVYYKNLHNIQIPNNLMSTPRNINKRYYARNLLKYANDHGTLDGFLEYLNNYYHK